MLPGKKYKPEDFARIALRRKWLIIVPFAVAAIATPVVARFLKDVYTSQALILVVPQRVPESFVRPTVTAQIEDRIKTISQQIMSRPRLERIIKEFDLYRGARETSTMEDVVERMRLDISVNIEGSRAKRDDGGSSFRVGYSSPDARKAWQVTERLASLFIEENLRDREVLAEGTDQFLESQLEGARAQLLENEKRLEAYRRKYAGQLPSQLQTNLQVLQHTETQLQTLADSANRDRDRLLALDRLIADAEAIPASPTPVPKPVKGGTDAQSLPTAPAAEQLEAARNELRALELRLKPEHPDVVRARRSIKELEKKAEAEALQAPLSPVARQPAPVTPEERARRNRLSELQAEKIQLTARLAQKGSEETRLRALTANYRSRVEIVPVRESELTALTRDYETLQERYKSLLSKREDARIAANLERRQIGEQFKLIDPARLPEEPISPNRGLIDLFGALAGLGVGLGLAVLAEYLDSTVKNVEDVAVSLGLPVLAVIPVITTTAERKSVRRRRMIVSLAAAATIVLTAGALIWKFAPWSAWVSR